MRRRQSDPHAPACLTYASTSTGPRIRVVIYLAIDEKLTITEGAPQPGRAYITARQRLQNRKASERMRLGG